MTVETSEARQGGKRLRRLQTFLDVAYAVLFVEFFFQYLPRTEDMAWEALPYGLLSLLIESSVDILRLIIAVGLTLISWNLTQKLLGPLTQTDAKHTMLALFQLIFVCMFLFFAIADPALESVSSPVGQSICLAISGFIGLGGFAYARKKGFVDPELPDEKIAEAVRGASIEPTTALLNTGLAFVGPGAWTLGWFLIPVAVVQIRKRLPSKRRASLP